MRRAKWKLSRFSPWCCWNRWGRKVGSGERQHWSERKGSMWTKQGHDSLILGRKIFLTWALVRVDVWKLRVWEECERGKNKPTQIKQPTTCKNLSALTDCDGLVWKMLRVVFTALLVSHHQPRGPGRYHELNTLQEICLAPYNACVLTGVSHEWLELEHPPFCHYFNVEAIICVSFHLFFSFPICTVYPQVLISLCCKMKYTEGACRN